MGFPAYLFLCVASLASRFSFIHAIRHDLGRVECWLALLSLSMLAENSRAE